MTNSELEKLIASAESDSEKICLLKNQDPDDDARLGEAHFALGWAVSRVGYSEKALEALLCAADFLERAGNKLREASTLHFIGNVLVGKYQFEASLKYYFKASSIRERLDDKHGQAASLSNIGLCYEQFGDYATGSRLRTQSTNNPTKYRRPIRRSHFAQQHRLALPQNREF